MNFYSGVLTGIVGLYLSLILGSKLVVWRYRRRLARELEKIDHCEICGAKGTVTFVGTDWRHIRLCPTHLREELAAFREEQ